jgi:hypothetical protein
MKKRGYLGFVMGLVCCTVIFSSLASASISVSVKNFPEDISFNRVEIILLKTGVAWSAIDSFFEKLPGGQDEISISSSSALSQIDVGVWLKTDNNVVKFYERYKGLSTSSPIVIKLVEKDEPEPEPLPELLNTSVAENDSDGDVESYGNGEAENESSGGFFTGLNILDVVKNNLKWIYISLGVILLGVVGFFGFKKYKKHKFNGSDIAEKISVKQLSDMSGGSSSHGGDELEDAKKRIREAEADLKDALSDLEKAKKD